MEICQSKAVGNVMRTLALVLVIRGVTVHCCELSFYELCECPPLANAGLFWKSTAKQMDPQGARVVQRF